MTDEAILQEDGTKQSCFWCEGEVIGDVCISKGCTNPLNLDTGAQR